MSLASKQNSIRPLGIGNGASSSRKDRSRLQINFAWTVTSSPAAYLCVLVVLKFMGSLLPDGWPEIMVQNRPLAIAARKVLGAELNVSEPYPEEFPSSLAAVLLPDASLQRHPLNEDPVQDWLRAQPALRLRSCRGPRHRNACSASRCNFTTRCRNNYGWLIPW